MNIYNIYHKYHKYNTMARKPKLNLDYSLLFRFDKETRQKIDMFQLNGVNVSDEFRKFIHKLYEEKIIKKNV